MKRKVLGDAAAVIVSLGITMLAAWVWRTSTVKAAGPSFADISALSVIDTALFVSRGNVLGARDARIWIVEFSDFECPYCAALHATLRQLRRQHPNVVSIVFRHFPLQIHPAAGAAAIASECAARQGKFEPYADALFELQTSNSRSNLQSIANNVGVLDTATFRRCLSSPSVRSVVESDISAGVKLGLQGTPALIVNGQLLVGAVPLDILDRIVRSLRVSDAGTD